MNGRVVSGAGPAAMRNQFVPLIQSVLKGNAWALWAFRWNEYVMCMALGTRVAAAQTAAAVAVPPALAGAGAVAA